MPVLIEFYKVWLRAPKIHAWREHDEPGGVEFSKGSRDEDAAQRWRGDIFIQGGGTRGKPFCTPAAIHSAHFDVLQMWYVLRTWERNTGKPIYIEVNDFIFSVHLDGVASEDGVMTRLA